MAILLFNLRDVPDDEADEVRALLDAQGIDWYETRPSLWGVSAGAIWLAQAGQEAEARRHLSQYQAQRSERQRAEQARDAAEGRGGRWRSFRQRPLQAAAALLGIVMMLALATLPFLFFVR